MSQKVNIQTLRKKTMPSNKCSGFTPTPIVESLRRVLCYFTRTPMVASRSEFYRIQNTKQL